MHYLHLNLTARPRERRGGAQLPDSLSQVGITHAIQSPNVASAVTSFLPLLGEVDRWNEFSGSHLVIENAAQKTTAPSKQHSYFVYARPHRVGVIAVMSVTCSDESHSGI
jgi:hypothetical protein